MEQRIYDVVEAAQYLKVARLTIVRYIRLKKLKAFKVGNSWRITSEAINEFIKINTR